MLKKWEAVIGLEIHVQLNTKTKMFGSEPYHFGSEPNTDIGVVCTGQPGALPIPNKEAVRKAIQFGLATKAKIAPKSTFDRKSYFYADTPKNFQITQFENPIIQGGEIACEVDGELKSFAINRAHLEEDAGMLKHFTSFSGIDYNRAGVPLLEIVSEPCFRSAKEASLYAQAIRAIVEYLDASDCNMEEGSLRIDANISVRLEGETALRNKTEIKNMNSFSNMEIAIDAEIKRQIALYTANNTAVLEKGTYRFDPEKGEAVLMRLKESSEDYRYFPEPDLPPLIVTEVMIEQERKALPELPQARFQRYHDALKLPRDLSQTLIAQKKLCAYFEEALLYCKNAKNLANWIIVEFVGRLKEKGKNPWDIGLSSQHVGELVQMIEEGTITGKIAKSVADEMVEKPHLSPKQIVDSNPDYKPVQDPKLIEALIDQILLENAQSVIDYKAGKTKAFAFLIGQVMKLSRGAASPDVVNKILTDKLK